MERKDLVLDQNAEVEVEVATARWAYRKTKEENNGCSERRLEVSWRERRACRGWS